jgi:hypothetical protein
MPLVDPFNISAGRQLATKSGMTGIDKLPIEGPIVVAARGPNDVGGSGLSAEAISDTQHRSGDDF